LELYMSEKLLDDLLKIDGVLQFFPVSKSTWWAGVKSGKYPKPIRLSPRRVAWRKQDIESLIERLGGDHDC